MLGSVTVQYIFSGSQGTVNMAAGEFSKEFDVDVKNSNSDPEKDRVLFFNLTSVTGSKNRLFFMVVTCAFYFEAEFTRLAALFLFNRTIPLVMSNRNYLLLLVRRFLK